MNPVDCSICADTDSAEADYIMPDESYTTIVNWACDSDGNLTPEAVVSMMIYARGDWC